MKPTLIRSQSGQSDTVMKTRFIGTELETQFNDLADLAAQLCEAPQAAFVLWDEDAAWVAAESGSTSGEALSDFVSSIQSGNRQPQQFADIHGDERFAGNPLLAADSELHFCACVPLIGRSGAVFGALCVTDNDSRHLNPRQMGALEKLARQAVALLEKPAPKLSTKTQDLQARYRRLMEASLDGILIADAASGQVLDANPCALQLLGFSRRELLGQSVWDSGILAEDDVRQDFRRELEETGALGSREVRFTTVDGEIRDVELILHRFNEKDHGFILCQLRDISERKQAENVDGEFREFIRSTLHGLAAQVVTLDPSDEIPLAEVDETDPAEDALSDGTDPEHLTVASRANGTWTREANMVVQGIREVMAKRRQDALQNETPGQLIEQRWFNAFVTYFMDSELMRIVVARQEVFERIIAEKQIGFQAKLLDVVGEAVIATDVEGKVTYWNRYAENLYGWTSAEAMGKHVASLLIPRHEWRRAREVLEKIKTGNSWSTEIILHDKNGIHFSAAVTNTPIFDNGELIGAIGISKDITEHKLAERKLRDSEQRFRLLVESVQDYAIFMLDLTGHVTSWNMGAQRLKGYRADEIIGRHFSTFYLPEDNEARLPETEIEIATATGRFEGEGLRVRKDGEKFWANVLITAIRDEKGVLRGFSKVTRDITERKKAEEELERTNREILTIWESMTDAFVAVDSNWTLTHVNEHAAYIWKKKREEVLGKNLWDMFPSAVWLSFHREYHRAVRDQIPVVFEEFYPPLNTWFEVHAYPSALGLSIYFRDVSQRKAAEQAIRNSEARFQSIVANAPGMVYQFILHPDGTVAIPFINDGCRRLFELSPEEVQSNPSFFEETVHPEDFSEWERSVRESARDLSPWDWEGRIVIPSGKMKWVQGAARPKRMPHGGTLWDGLLMEITDRKQAEEERDRFFTLSLDMLCISDFNGEFKRLNPAFETTLGYSLSELQSRSFLDFVHPDDREFAAGQLKSLAEGAQTLQFLTRYRCKNGNYKWLSWQTVPYGDLAYAVAHDITPLKEAESELRTANDELELRVTRRTEQLARSNEELRVENIERQMTLASLRQVTEAFRQAKEEADAANLAKSEFLSRMSHELRTPLNAILGFGQILEMRSLEPEDLASISHILKAGWHLLDLVNEILDIARVEAGHLELSPEAIAVSDVVPECCSLLRPLADQREIKLDENGSAVSPYFVLADRQRLRQILINLLSNGIKYNHSSGQVYVSSELTANNKIRISVRDTGPGISESDTKKLFTPFERLSAGNSKIEGSGLGLALSQRLLSAMNGKLGVQSELGQGSTFWIELPQAEAPDPALMTTSESNFDLENFRRIHGSKTMPAMKDWLTDSVSFESEDGRKSKIPQLTLDGFGDDAQTAFSLTSSQALRILVVEDNHVNQQVIYQQLKNLGHEVILLDNGISAIETWQRQPVDLILMDCNMPHMNGYVAAREIRSLESEDRHIPIIALTANAMSGDREKCLAAGMDDYLSKPTKQARLAEVIERWVAHLGAPNEMVEEPQIIVESEVLKSDRWNELQTELDADLLKELVRMFLDETPMLMETLRQTIESGNSTAVYQNAHKIKGSCATMGAGRMETTCREMEKCAESQNLVECTSLMERLLHEFGAVEKALNSYLNAP